MKCTTCLWAAAESCGHIPLNWGEHPPPTVLDFPGLFFMFKQAGHLNIEAETGFLR